MLIEIQDMDDSEIQVLKELSLKDPSDIRWWIYPHNCTIMNGFFMYIIMKKSGFNISIYESNSHTFLKDNNGKVIDMYWQPLGYNDKEHLKEYNDGVMVNPQEFLENYDILRFLPEDIKNIINTN